MASQARLRSRRCRARSRAVPAPSSSRSHCAPSHELPLRLRDTVLQGSLLKAIRIHEDGGPEVLRYEDAPDPVPGPGEVLVELRAASLNHLDLWVRKGLPSVPKPRILGADGAGLVDGKRVVINPGIEHGDKISVVGEHMDGTHAELIAVPESNVYPIPDGMSFEEAAAFPLVFETAYRMLATKAGVREGEWVLVWGIGGGLGGAANVIARAMGARTIV